MVKLVRVGAITVQVHDSRKRRDQPAKECGLLIGHHRGLSHGHGHNHSRYAVRQAGYDWQLRGKRVFLRCDKSGSARSGFDSFDLHKINCQ